MRRMTRITNHVSSMPATAPATVATGTHDVDPSLWQVERFQMPLAKLQAQRLWVLERPEAESRAADADVCGFAGAVVVLQDECVYGMIVRSPEWQRASDVPLREGSLRMNLARDAFRFATLDDAVAAMDHAKQTLLIRGWTEAIGPPTR